MMGRSLAPTLELEALRTYLGTQYAADLQNFMEGKYSNDESLKKRANGLIYLGRSIIKTKRIFQDDDRHNHFWKEIAKKTIDVRYGLTFSGQYDPARFYLDALDFSAVASFLPSTLTGGEIPVSHRMIDVLQSLNAREADNGGYFGNTPYWTLHNHQIWRLHERDFTSVQAYWFSLMLVDEAASTLSMDITRALISEGELISLLTPEEREDLISNDITKTSQYICFGALSFAATKNLNSPRLKTLNAIVESVAPSSNHAFQAVMSTSASSGIAALQVLVDENHFFHKLPEHSFILNLNLKAAFIKLLALTDIIETIGLMPKTENLIENPRESVPHLLHASM
ncbi:hypothetical protein [Deinococcus sp. PESE-13]